MRTVVFSESHLASFRESLAGTFSATAPSYFTGGLMVLPIQRWTSEWPSANEKPQAPLC